MIATAAAEESFGNTMSDIEDQVLEMIKGISKAPKDALEAWQAFQAAVNWTETWIRCLLASHVFLFVLVIVKRKSIEFQAAIFFTICILVALSERINRFCSQNWRSFSTQNYFDEHGAFAGIFFAGPYLFIALVILVSMQETRIEIENSQSARS